MEVISKVSASGPPFAPCMVIWRGFTNEVQHGGLVAGKEKKSLKWPKSGGKWGMNTQLNGESGASWRRATGGVKPAEIARELGSSSRCRGTEAHAALTRMVSSTTRATRAHARASVATQQPFWTRAMGASGRFC